MTGFGRGNAGRGKNRIDVEIRAINSRYLDTKFRGIQLDFQLEQEIKKIIEKEIQRGSVYVHVEITNDLDSRKFTFDKDRLDFGNRSEIRICVLSNIDSEYCLIRGEIFSEVSVVDLFNSNLISSIDSFLNSSNFVVNWFSMDELMSCI